MAYQRKFTICQNMVLTAILCVTTCNTGRAACKRIINCQHASIASSINGAVIEASKVLAAVLAFVKGIPVLSWTWRWA